MEIARGNVKFNFEDCLEPSTCLVKANISADENLVKVEGSLEIHYVHPQNSAERPQMEWRLEIDGKPADVGRTDGLMLERRNLDNLVQGAIVKSTHLMHEALREKQEKASKLADKQRMEQQARTAIWDSLNNFLG